MPSTTPIESLSARRPLPAWLMSTVFHLLLFVLLALLIRGKDVPARDEPSRSVGIVLADTSASQTPNYLDQSDVASESVASAATPSISDPLPPQAPPVLPDMALPGQDIDIAATVGENLLTARLFK